MPGFVKRYADASIAAESLRRSKNLSAIGVPTPAAVPGDSPDEVNFDKLGGTTGLPLLEQDLTHLFEPLISLHGSRITRLGPFDPFVRTRPRLWLTDSDEIRKVLGEPVPDGTAVLHGDLHVGQFIREPAGKVWIVDLDDLAFGPAEADLANFTAHCATSQTGGLSKWTSRVKTAWRQLRQPLDEEIFDQFLKFALVRRHLKLCEAGRPDFKADILAYLRESSSFSIR